MEVLLRAENPRKIVIPVGDSTREGVPLEKVANMTTDVHTVVNEGMGNTNASNETGWRKEKELKRRKDLSIRLVFQVRCCGTKTMT